MISPEDVFKSKQTVFGISAVSRFKDTPLSLSPFMPDLKLSTSDPETYFRSFISYLMNLSSLKK
ncbi:MAG: hypothetical protein FJZ76_07740 [Bacteroidetes bacterium]|nr:hypothetical protein [Bacteroidota bacterium]